MVYRYYTPAASKKYGWKYDGPFLISRHIGGKTYEVLTAKGKLKWHVDQLKSAFNRDGSLRQVANLQHADEYQALQSVGREILKVVNGRVLSLIHI